MNLYNVQRALTATFTANIGIDKVVENIDYTPTLGTPYAQLFFVPVDSPIRTVGPSTIGKIEHFGFIQITLKYPVGVGSKSIREKADSIMSNEFAIGTLHTYNSVTARIYKHEVGQGRNVDGWHTLDLTIYWQTFEARP